MNYYGNQTHTTVSVHVGRIIGKYGFTRDDRDDLVQDLFLDLIQRSADFDNSRSTWETFFARLVRNKLANLARRQAAAKRDFRLCQTSLNDLRFEDDGPEHCGAEDKGATANVGEAYVAELILRIDVARAIRKLKPELIHLVMQLMSDTITQAAHELRISRSTAHRQVRFIRHVFEDAGLHRYISRTTRLPTNGGRS